jgi:acetyltransferase-like isoleucine patch superfamily enzyme
MSNLSITEPQPSPKPLHPCVQQWLARVDKATAVQRPSNPSATTSLRHWWWGTREGLTLYFYNHILGHIPSHALRLLFYRRIMEIGRQSSILMGLTLYYPGRVVIGDNSVINGQCVLDSRAGIYIGNSVSLSPYVHIWAGGHDINNPNFVSQGGVTILEDYVWVGSRVTILGGATGASLTLGEGCVVSAGSVVVRDVEPYTVVAGNPARKIAVRSRDVDYKLNFFPPFR